MTNHPLEQDPAMPKQSALATELAWTGTAESNRRQTKSNHWRSGLLVTALLLGGFSASTTAFANCGLGQDSSDCAPDQGRRSYADDVTARTRSRDDVEEKKRQQNENAERQHQQQVQEEHQRQQVQQDQLVRQRQQQEQQEQLSRQRQQQQQEQQEQLSRQRQQQQQAQQEQLSRQRQQQQQAQQEQLSRQRQQQQQEQQEQLSRQRQQQQQEQQEQLSRQRQQQQQEQQEQLSRQRQPQAEQQQQADRQHSTQPTRQIERPAPAIPETATDSNRPVTNTVDRPRNGAVETNRTDNRNERANGTVPPVAANHGNERGADDRADMRSNPRENRHESAISPVYHVPEQAVARRNNGAAELDREGSRNVLQQVNSARATLPGVNAHVIPSGTVTAHENGRLTVRTGDNREFGLHADGRIASYRHADVEARFHADGHVAVLHTPSLDVRVVDRGIRRVVFRRPDLSIVVSNGPRSAYVQRPVYFGGRNYVRRTYVVNNVRYNRVYVNYRYGNVVMVHYVPRFYYVPAFYGWAYYPWDIPIAFTWGWIHEPWYRHYGVYYSPWPRYAAPNYWLADNYLANVMEEDYRVSEAAQERREQEAYEEGEAAGREYAYAQETTPISSELKEQIAEEVKQQIAYNNAASQDPDKSAELSGLPQVLVPGHAFVVDSGLSVLTDDDKTCKLKAGDVIKLIDTPRADAKTADLSVAASRKDGCPAGAVVTVSIEDLNEMHNSFQTHLDSGMKTLRDNQGKNGLPSAPHSAIAPPPRPAPDVPDGDDDVSGLNKTALQQADDAEKKLNEEAFKDSAP